MTHTAVVMSPWTLGWDALVAIGTLGLAGVTLILGLVAMNGNKVARNALAISQAELQATTFPLIESVPLQHGEQRSQSPPDLVDYGNLGGQPPDPEWRFRDVVDVNGQAGGVFISVPIRNVGPGIARIAGVQPRALSIPDVIWTDGVCTRALIPSGEYARLNFRLSGLREEAYAEVFYSDNSGEGQTRVRLYVKGERDEKSGKMGYIVRGTAMYRDGVDRPFAIAGDPRVADAQPSQPAVETRLWEGFQQYERPE